MGAQSECIPIYNSNHSLKNSNVMSDRRKKITINKSNVIWLSGAGLIFIFNHTQGINDETNAHTHTHTNCVLKLIPLLNFSFVPF